MNCRNALQIWIYPKYKHILLHCKERIEDNENRVFPYGSNSYLITICMTGDSTKVTETNLLLHFVSHANMLTNYSEELFESYADHIEISGRNEIKFVMKCGLTFPEKIGN